MSFANELGSTKLTYPSTGEVVTSPKWQDMIERIKDPLELVLKALCGDDMDGTYDDSFQVSDSGGLFIDVSGGWGIIAGLVIYAAVAETNIAVPDDSTVYVFLKQTATTKTDNSFTVEVSLAAPPLADAIYIAKVTTAGGVITDIDNAPAGRDPYLRNNPNPQIISDIPGLLVVAPAGGAYTDPKTAIEAATAGQVVLICAGTYNQANAIVVPANNITIIGVSRDACVLANTAAAGTVHNINLNGKDGIRIAHLTLSTAAGNAGSCVYANGCDDLLLEDCLLTSPAGTAAVILSTAARPTVMGCRFTGSAADSIQIVTCTDGFIFQNRFEHAGTGSVRAISANNSDRIHIRQNQIAMTGAAPTGCIYAYNMDDLRIESNLIRVPTPGAIVCIDLRAHNDGANKGCRITQNNIRGAGDVGTGIRIYSSAAGNTQDDTTVADNQVFDFATGVLLQDARVQETMLHDNNLHTNTTAYTDTGTNTSIQDNS